MTTFAKYDVLTSFRDIHKVVLNLADSLDDEQLKWRPAEYSTSIGFHLWHLARESDYLKAAINKYFPQLGPDFGDGREIWHQEGLAQRWGFPAELAETVGTGISDELAANIPLPAKSDLMDYLSRSYLAIEGLVELLDGRYADFEQVDQDMRLVIERVRQNLLVFLSHDARHLGMMECLKGLQTGFGSATEQRNNEDNR